VVTIQAGFQNTGVADTLVTFTGQVYLGANLINVINSQSTIVPAGQLGTIISYLKLSQTGNYTIKGYISYAGKQTVTKVITINVGGSGKMSYLLYIITGVLVIIAISAGTFIILRKTRKHPPEKAP
jgi:hypothetical protein